MNKRKSAKQVEKSLKESIREFLESHPGISYEDYMKHVEMITTVAFLPPPLFMKYRDSGKSVEEVYEEITSRKN